MQPASAYWLPLALGAVWLAAVSLGAARCVALWRRRTQADGWQRRMALIGLALVQVGLPLVALLLAAEGLWRHLAPEPYLPGRPGDFVLVVVGGSTAEGRPRCASFGPAVATALGGEVRGQRILPLVLAQGGHSVAPQAVALERTLQAWPAGRAGAVLIYAGHNDRIVPDVGTPWYWPLEHVASQRLWLVRDALWTLRQLRWTERTASLAAYRDLLEQMVVQTKAAGLLPVLSTVASNLIDLEPGVELDDAALTSPDHSAPGTEAWWLFQRARAAYEGGNYDQALALAWQAVDRDRRVMFGRATTAQNRVVQEVAARHGALLVDGVQAVSAGAPHGIPGAESFIDGHHPSIAGYARLNAAMATAIAGRLGVSVSQLPDPAAAVPAGCTADEVARALVGGASWLLATSAGSVPMPRRLALAEQDLWRSLALVPGWSAWAGLALVHAARQAGTADAKGTASVVSEWITRMHASHREEFCLVPKDAAALPELLRAAKVPALIEAGLTLQALWGEAICAPSQVHARHEPVDHPNRRLGPTATGVSQLMQGTEVPSAECTN